MKRFLFIGMIFVFVSSTIFAMEQEVKKETKQEEVKQKAEKPKTGFPQELTINETKDTLTSVNIENKDPLSLETLKEIMDEQTKNNIPFIIARVTSMSADENILTSYYVPQFIHGHVYGDPKFLGKGYSRYKDATQFGLNGPKSVQDPLTKGFIAGPIRYYVYLSTINKFIYLASDYDFTEPTASDQENYPKRLLLEKIFQYYYKDDSKHELLSYLGSFFIYTNRFTYALECYKPKFNDTQIFIKNQFKEDPKREQRYRKTVAIASIATVKNNDYVKRAWLTTEELEGLIKVLEKGNPKEVKEYIYKIH